MPTGDNDRLELMRTMIIAALIEVLTVDFVHITADELFIRAQKTQTAFLFPCLITELCKKVKVSLISGVDNKIQATNNQDIKKTKDYSRFEM